MKLQPVAMLLLILVGCAPPGVPAAKEAGNPVSSDAGTEAPLRALSTQPAPRPQVGAGQATFSPDGKLLLIQYYCTSSTKRPHNFGGVRLWDVTTGANISAFRQEEACLAFLADSKQVLSCRVNQPLRVWEAVTGEVVRTFDETSKGVSSLAVSTDGKLALTNGPTREGVQLWDVRTGKPLRTLGVTGAPCLQFSPDGKCALAGCRDGSAMVYSVARGESLLVVEGHGRLKYPLAISHDGQFAVSDYWDGDDREKPTLVLWELTGGKELRTFEERQGGINVGRAGSAGAAAFTPDGKYVLSADHDSMLRLWNVATGRVVWAIPVDGFYTPSVLAVSADAALAFTNTQAEDRASGGRIWDGATGKLLRSLKGLTESVSP